MFRIKICGITNVADALAAADAGADAIGLNFFPESRRCVDLATARAVIEVLPERVAAVGLFVNATAAHVCSVADELRLDLIQLHGDEPVEYLAQLGQRRVMKAFRAGADGLSGMIAYVEAAEASGTPLRMVLLDAAVPGKFGGTGQLADWNAALELSCAVTVPLVLAGGLTPENVAEAIRAVRPAAVDTSSGVESSPGHKDPVKVREFVAEAATAFQFIESA